MQPIAEPGAGVAGIGGVGLLISLALTVPGICGKGFAAAGDFVSSRIGRVEGESLLALNIHHMWLVHEFDIAFEHGQPRLVRTRAQPELRIALHQKG